MPVLRQTLPLGNQYTGLAGNGEILMPIGLALGADVANSDDWAAKIVLISLNLANDANVPTGSVFLEPLAGSQGLSDRIPIKKWNAGLSGFLLPCDIPVPETYVFRMLTGVLGDEATLTVWWKGFRP